MCPCSAHGWKTHSWTRTVRFGAIFRTLANVLVVCINQIVMPDRWLLFSSLYDRHVRQSNFSCMMLTMAKQQRDILCVIVNVITFRTHRVGLKELQNYMHAPTHSSTHFHRDTHTHNEPTDGCQRLYYYLPHCLRLCVCCFGRSINDHSMDSQRLQFPDSVCEPMVWWIDFERILPGGSAGLHVGMIRNLIRSIKNELNVRVDVLICMAHTATHTHTQCDVAWFASRFPSPFFLTHCHFRLLFTPIREILINLIAN